MGQVRVEVSHLRETTSKALTDKGLVLRNIRSLVTGDDACGVLSNVDMLCANGVISAIAPNLAEQIDLTDYEILDCSQYFVYPGLINTHHHFFQAFVRNRIDLEWSQLSLVEWLRRIYPIFSRIDENCIYHASVVAMAELIKCGCTTAFDHQYCYNDHAGKFLIDRQFDAADLTGIRFIAGRGVNSLPAAAGSTMPDSMVETTAEYLEDAERLITTFHDPKPYAMKNIALAPCQPINCYQDTFTESIALARQYGVGLHTHLSEGENAVMLNRYGMRSLDWCEAVGFVGPDVWVAHGWELTRDEMFKMAELEIGLSHCPAPMCLVGDAITDLNAAYAAGVRIGLGVDGYASNDNSNLMASIHEAYLLQCLAAKDRNDPAPPVAAFMHMATTGGAHLLNRPELGSLAAGQAADFFAIDASAIELVGAAHDPLHLLVKVGSSAPTAFTVINGKIVWRDGAFTRFDESEAARAAERAFHHLLEKSKVSP
ncbi:MAG: amidohydrolase [Thiotrichales bacterium]